MPFLSFLATFFFFNWLKTCVCFFRVF
jgi:hypothetical protein